MILLKELLELKPQTTDFSAISKKSGKLVYFSSKDKMDAAIKHGTHTKPKIKGKDVSVVKQQNIFTKDNSKQKEIKPKVEKQKYTKNEVEKLDKIFDSMEDWGGFGKYNRTPQIIAQTANKFGIDVNRVLSNPEKFVELYNGETYGETPLDFTLQALGHTIYFADDVDAAYHLADLQLVYPLKYKSLSDKEWNKRMQADADNPTTVDASLRKYQTDEIKANEDWEIDARNNRKEQSNWVKQQAKKNKKYAETMLEYQQMISKPALNDIDKMLISNPPPPIKAKALYRGMAMKPGDLKKFLKKFEQGSNVELPIASFSSDPSIATGFANNVDNDNALIDKSNNQAVVIKVVNSKNQFNGFSMNANIDNVKSPNPMSPYSNWAYQEEVLLPSNNAYKVLKMETNKLEGGRSLTTITLEQKGIKNQMKLKEFIQNTEIDIFKKHLQYPNRLSLLYKKEGV